MLAPPDTLRTRVCGLAPCGGPRHLSPPERNIFCTGPAKSPCPDLPPPPPGHPGRRPPANPALGRRSPCPPARAARRTPAARPHTRGAGDPVPGSRGHTTPPPGRPRRTGRGRPCPPLDANQRAGGRAGGARPRKGSRRDPVRGAPTATQPTVERNDGRRHHHQPLQQPAFKRASQWGRFLNKSS